MLQTFERADFYVAGKQIDTQGNSQTPGLDHKQWIVEGWAKTS